MSILFPHAEYAEDRPLSRTILTTHVLHRGFQTDTSAGILVGALRSLPLLFRSPLSQPQQTRIFAASQAAAAAPALAPTAPLKPQYRTITTATAAAAHTAAKRSLSLPAIWHTIERSAGVDAVAGLGAMAVMLPGYMRGKKTVEWQDRSWRLLANEGQVEVDSWSLGGAAVGVTALLQRRWRDGGVGRVAWKHVVGRAGVGSMVGVVGYMGWRYGVMKGQR